MEAKPSKAFTSIKHGLDEALEFAIGSENNAVTRKLTGAEAKGLLETDFERNKDNVRQARSLN